MLTPLLLCVPLLGFNEAPAKSGGEFAQPSHYTQAGIGLQ